MRRLQASITVEAVLIFPIIFVLLIAMLQCGLYYAYSLAAKCWCDQGAAVYQEALDQGRHPWDAVNLAGAYIEKQMKAAGLKEVDVFVKNQGKLLFYELQIEAKGRYRLLFDLQVCAAAKEEWREARTLRDTAELLQEIGRRVPGVSEIMDHYEEVLDQCLEVLD